MSLDRIDFLDLLANIGPPILKFIVLMVVIKIASRLLANVVAKTPTTYSAQLEYLAPKLVWGLGLIIIFSSYGVNISSFLALFTTIGIGAALIFTPVGQGLLAGFLAGMDDVIREGDVVDVLGRPGTVVRTGALSMGIEYPDGSQVYLPNLKMIQDELINHNRIEGARIMVELKLNLHPDRARAVRVMEQTLDSLPWQHADKPTAVHFAKVGSNAFHYHCYAWTERRLDEPECKSKLLTALVDDLEAAGISVGETSDLSMSSWPSAWEDVDVDLTATGDLARNKDR